MTLGSAVGTVLGRRDIQRECIGCLLLVINAGVVKVGEETSYNVGGSC